MSKELTGFQVMFTIFMSFIFVLAIIFGLIIYFHVGLSHAYTIVDTVYVPDSITVTMSWEEWEQVRMLFAQDSLWDRVWELDPDSDSVMYFEPQDTLNTPTVFKNL